MQYRTLHLIYRRGGNVESLFRQRFIPTGYLLRYVLFGFAM